MVVGSSGWFCFWGRLVVWGGCALGAAWRLCGPGGFAFGGAWRFVGWLGFGGRLVGVLSGVSLFGVFGGSGVAVLWLWAGGAWWVVGRGWFWLG